MEKTIPQTIIDEIIRRETLGQYYKNGRTSMFHLLNDLDKLMLKSYHAE